MNKKLLVLLIGALMLFMTLRGALAADLTMKTNEAYTAYYKVSNPEPQTLRNCIPLISGTLNQPFVLIEPSRFNLYQDGTQDIRISISNPEPGIYEGMIQIMCDYYTNNVFVKNGPILNPAYAPTYKLIVKIAGEGQAYAFNSKTFNYVSKGGTTETANFIIANTGTVPLNTIIKIPPDQNIQITPLNTTIISGGSQTYKITIRVPTNFQNQNITIPIYIGDYLDYFTVIGERESLETTGAPVQSIGFQSTTTIGKIQIPTIIILLMIIVAGYFLLSEGKKK